MSWMLLDVGIVSEDAIEADEERKSYDYTLDIQKAAMALIGSITLDAHRSLITVVSIDRVNGTFGLLYPENLHTEMLQSVLAVDGSFGWTSNVHYAPTSDELEFTWFVLADVLSNEIEALERQIDLDLQALSPTERDTVKDIMKKYGGEKK